MIAGLIMVVVYQNSGETQGLFSLFLVLDLILDVGLMPDSTTSIFVAIATDGNHFVLVEEAVEFSFSEQDIEIASGHRSNGTEQGSKVFLSHESSIPETPLTASPNCVYYDFFFFLIYLTRKSLSINELRTRTRSFAVTP